LGTYQHNKSAVLIKFLFRLFPFCCLAVACTPEETALPPTYRAQLELGETTLLVESVAAGLDIPWDIAWGPDDRLWFTEQRGTVNRLDPQTGTVTQLLQLPDVHYQKSRGLLGMAVSDDLTAQPFVFLHYTYLVPNDRQATIIESRLVRYTYAGDTLTDPLVLLDAIPGKTFHNGSRILLLADGTLLLSTGDAGDQMGAQDTISLVGKVLRLNPDGTIPADNPWPGSPVWTVGHRNIQGLAQYRGQVYASEHGPNNDDEVNLLLAGHNYGWPVVHGFCDQPAEEAACAERGITEPLFAWTPTVAAAGLAHYAEAEIPEWQHSLLLVNLKGQAFRVLHLNEDGTEVADESIYLQRAFGRLRDVCVAPNGDIYLATSNRDWHPRYQPFMYDSLPTPEQGADRILRLRPVPRKRALAWREQPGSRVLTRDTAASLPSEDWSRSIDQDQLAVGAALYLQHCAACHRPDGMGTPELVPPLAQTDWVTGEAERLIRVVLHGTSEPMVVNGATYEQEMPGYAAILDDNELAAVLSYIRGAFGNTAGPVLSYEVGEERTHPQTPSL
jgi:glucose/arabinose dehydrogenase